MPWNSRNYPDSMKNLPKQTREKAIEIANALLDEQYEEGRAIAIATAQAEKWADDGGPAAEEYLLQKKDDKWAIGKEDSKRASYTFHTKADAVKKARELAREKNASVKVYKEDGSQETAIN
ncbi:DUF2188 domain-containing protein [Bacillus mangrovi]|uniref:DUF2188 domain-containing protein n=1 Tax=Metabacillus mangrovi TaxID=1491830 RepID=A0A7X2S387_9BACI|nr:DUF2188 domain-containing protein [Metabacillus mangrovi]MTH51996.1 DUF2188 domain-containing protein [Metabacillus mangrovi]